MLGYVDAVDERTGVDRRIGPDLLVVPCWTPRVLRGDRAGGRLSSASPPIPTTRCPGTRCRSPPSARASTRSSRTISGRRIWPQLQEVWPLIDYHGLRDAFVIRYALGEQESLREHHDVAQVSASVKLDDDHEGAELRFPRQGVDNAGVPVGSLLAWPSLVTHPARGGAAAARRQARPDDLVRAAVRLDV